MVANNRNCCTLKKTDEFQLFTQQINVLSTHYMPCALLGSGDTSVERRRARETDRQTHTHTHTLCKNVMEPKDRNAAEP